MNYKKVNRFVTIFLVELAQDQNTQSNKGRIQSSDTRKKISFSNLGKHQWPSTRSRTLSKEQREKISESLISLTLKKLSEKFTKVI
jgi:hypothetical protein